MLSITAVPGLGFLGEVPAPGAACGVPAATDSAGNWVLNPDPDTGAYINLDGKCVCGQGMMWDPGSNGCVVAGTTTATTTSTAPSKTGSRLPSALPSAGVVPAGTKAGGMIPGLPASAVGVFTPKNFAIAAGLTLGGVVLWSLFKTPAKRASTAPASSSAAPGVMGLLGYKRRRRR